MAWLQVSGFVGVSDFRYSPNGVAVLTVTVADRRWNFKEEKEETEWIRAVWFGEKAEKLSNTLPKVKILSILGREAYKIYDGKIDRTIEPIDFSILQFKKTEDSESEKYPPPMSDDDLPPF